MATRSSTLHYYINLLKAEQIKRAEGERRFLKLLKCTADLNDKLSLRERASLGPKVGEVEVGISSGVEEQLLRIAESKDVLIKELSDTLVNVAERELDERDSKAQYRYVVSDLYLARFHHF